MKTYKKRLCQLVLRLLLTTALADLIIDDYYLLMYLVTLEKEVETPL